MPNNGDRHSAIRRSPILGTLHTSNRSLYGGCKVVTASPGVAAPTHSGPFCGCAPWHSRGRNEARGYCSAGCPQSARCQTRYPAALHRQCHRCCPMCTAALTVRGGTAPYRQGATVYSCHGSPQAPVSGAHPPPHTHTDTLPCCTACSGIPLVPLLLPDSLPLTAWSTLVVRTSDHRVLHHKDEWVGAAQGRRGGA